MQVSDISKNWYHVNSTYRSMIPLVWILKIFALNCNVNPTFKPSFVLIKFLCTGSALGLLSFYSFYYKINHVYFKLDLSIKLTDMVQIISDYCQYIVDLYFVYKYGGNVCMEYYKQYEKIDKFLEVTCYSAMKRKLLKRMAFFMTIWAMSSFGDLGAWVVTYGWMVPTAHSVSYVFLFIKILTILDLIAHITHIEIRLRIVTNIVQNCYSSIDACPDGLGVDCVSNKNWLYQDDDKDIHSPKVRFNCSSEINRLSRCYLMLTEQVAFINQIYGIRILLNTLSLLLDMVKITNLATRIIIGSQRTFYNNESLNFLPGISGTMRVLTCAVILIGLVQQCEQAYYQRDRIINVIDHLLVNKNPDDELRSSIVTLRTLLQERAISFNMANFFTLNYSLLVSITSVVVTYTIILLQSVN